MFTKIYTITIRKYKLKIEAEKTSEAKLKAAIEYKNIFKPKESISYLESITDIISKEYKDKNDAYFKLYQKIIGK